MYILSLAQEETQDKVADVGNQDKENELKKRDEIIEKWQNLLCGNITSFSEQNSFEANLDKFEGKLAKEEKVECDVNTPRGKKVVKKGRKKLKNEKDSKSSLGVKTVKRANRKRRKNMVKLEQNSEELDLIMSVSENTEDQTEIETDDVKNNGEISNEAVEEDNQDVVDGASEEKVSKFKCQICDKVFKSKQNLDIHVRGHTGEKPFSCDFCPKKFNTKSNLKTHTMYHAGDRKYNCPVCDKAFYTKKDLNTHKLLHTGLRPWECDICGRSFNTASILRCHKQTHTGEKNFQCDICLKCFTRSSTLVDHKRMHSGIKNYCCDECGKSFGMSQYLKRHKLTHSSIRPYKCELCLKTFVSKSKLTTHLRTHSGERPYCCETCGRAFSDWGNFHAHRKIHSENKKPRNRSKKKKVLNAENVSLDVSDQQTVLVENIELSDVLLGQNQQEQSLADQDHMTSRPSMDESINSVIVTDETVQNIIAQM